MPTNRAPLAAPAGAHTAEAAEHIADVGLELARIARMHHLDLLAYFLDMAVLEANRQSRGGDEPA